MTDVFSVKQLSFDESLLHMREEWNQLLSQSTRPSIYACFDYLVLAVKYFAHTAERTFIVTMRDSESGQLRAIFPMSVGIRKCFQRKVKVLEHCITTHNSDVDKPYPIIHKKYESACWLHFKDYIQNEFKDWDWLEYDELIPESQLNTSLKKLFRLPRYFSKQNPGPVSPIVNLRGDWQVFWSQHRNMRKKARRMQKKLRDGYDYRVFDNEEDMSACLQQYIEIEKAGWKSNKGVSEAVGQQFYSELLPKLAQLKLACFGILYDGEQPVSTELSFVFLDTVYFAHGTYHPDYHHLSPGTVSTSLFIKHFYGKGYKSGDFLAGFADYVNPLAERVDKTKDTVVYKLNGIFFYYTYKVLLKKLRSKLKRIYHRFSGVKK